GAQRGQFSFGHDLDDRVLALTEPFRVTGLLELLPHNRAALASWPVLAALLLRPDVAIRHGDQAATGSSTAAGSTAGVRSASRLRRLGRSWSGSARRTILRTTVPNCFGSGPVLYGIPYVEQIACTSGAISAYRCAGMSGNRWCSIWWLR